MGVLIPTTVVSLRAMELSLSTIAGSLTSASATRTGVISVLYPTYEVSTL